MLKQWGLGNFKSFYEETKLDLAPLTILTGGNSSGKSSIIQSILLITQTLENPMHERELILNGPLIELGFLRDNLSNQNKDLSINFTYSTLDSAYKVLRIECSVLFDSNEKLQKFNCIQEVTYRYTEDKEKNTITIKRTKDGDMVIEDSVGNFKPDLDLYGDPQKANGIKITLDHFLPKHYFFAPDHPKMVEIIKKAHFEFLEDLKKIIPFNFDHIRDDIAKKLLEKIRSLLDNEHNDSPDNIKEINRYVKLLNETELDNDNEIMDLDDLIWGYSFQENILGTELSESITHVNNFIKIEIFSKIKYIGPLRFRSAVYPFSQAFNPKDIGISGEYVASVLHEFSKNNVSYLAPHYVSNYYESLINRKELELKEALENWLEYFGICKEIKVEQFGKAGFSLKIKPLKSKIHDSDGYLDLTQVGTGISQVLPILTMGLLAEKNSILLFEQPELHLHPPMQARLADFFISLALLGKQCIIESHSEYFIDIFRARISKSLLNNSEHIKNITKIYFFEKEDSCTKVIPIEINEYAGYTDWPEGFFEERHKIDEEILENLNEKTTYDDDDSELLDD